MSSSYFIDSNGNIWCCGDNRYGQLGLGDNVNRTRFEKINIFPEMRFVQFSYTRYYVVVLDELGNIWLSGSRTTDGSHTLITNKLIKICYKNKIIQVCCDVKYTKALDINNNIICFNFDFDKCRSKVTHKLNNLCKIFAVPIIQRS